MLIMMLIMMWSLVVDQNKTWTSGQEGSSITVPAFAASAPDCVIIILNIIIIIFIVSNVNKSLDFPFFGGQCCLFTNAVMSWPSSPDRKVGPRLTVTLANLKKKITVTKGWSTKNTLPDHKKTKSHTLRIVLQHPCDLWLCFRLWWYEKKLWWC